LGLLRAASLRQQQAHHRWDDGGSCQDIAPALGMFGEDVVFIVGHIVLPDPVRRDPSAEPTVIQEIQEILMEVMS
jgi:hypothetical protein